MKNIYTSLYSEEIYLRQSISIQKYLPLLYNIRNSISGFRNKCCHKRNSHLIFSFLIIDNLPL